jgi:hypothetical protein
MALKPFSTLKPSHPAAIDWSNPITQGLVFYCLFNSSAPIDLVTGTPGAPNNGPTFKAGPDGISTALAAASNQYWVFPGRSSWNTVGPSSILFKGNLASGGAYRQIVSKNVSNGASNNPYEFRSNGGGGIEYTRATASTYTTWYGPSITAGLNQTVIATFANSDLGTAPSFMLDGAFSTGTGGSGSGTVTGNAADLWIGRRQDGGTQWDGTISVIGIWARQLTNAEQIQLQISPFSIILPIRVNRAVQAPIAPLTADVGAFTLSGQAVSFDQALSAGTGAFTLAGQDVAFGITLAADVGAFVLAGQDVSFADTMQADVGSFTLAGQDVAFGLALAADVGAFTLSGQDVSFGDTMAADVGAFVFAGQDANLLTGSSFSVDVGAFTLTGQNVSFGQTLLAGTGAFVLAGQNADFFPILFPATGAFILNGQSVTFTTTGLTVGARTPRPRVPEYQPDDKEHRRQIARSLNLAMSGHLDCTIMVTLTPSVASTTVTDARIGVNTAAIAVPLTADASAEQAAGGFYVRVSDGSMTIYHANSAATGRIFMFALLG